MGEVVPFPKRRPRAAEGFTSDDISLLETTLELMRIGKRWRSAIQHTDALEAHALCADIEAIAKDVMSYLIIPPISPNQCTSAILEFADRMAELQLRFKDLSRVMGPFIASCQ